MDREDGRGTDLSERMDVIGGRVTGRGPSISSYKSPLWINAAQTLNFTVKAKMVVCICSTSSNSARGTLFRVTLASHGYTFVGKAIREVYMPKLQQEGRIYNRLEVSRARKYPFTLEVLTSSGHGMICMFD